MTSIHASKLFKNWTQILAIFIVGLSMLNYGLLMGWPSPAIVAITNGDYPLQLTYDEASYFTVFPPIAAIITSAPVGYLIHRIGPKNTMILGTIPYFIAWILVSIGGSKWIFYASRFITGFGDACAIGATSPYVGEIALPKVRGKWGNMLVFSLLLGILMAYIIGGNLSIPMTSYICMGFPVMQFILLCGLPESPYFLLTKKRHEDAKKSLQWFRQRDDVDTEFAEITSAVAWQMQAPGSYSDILFIKANRKAVIANVMSRFAQIFSGMFAFVAYAQTIFERAGGNLTSSTSAIICAAIDLLAAVAGALIVDKLGRRKTMFSSAVSSIIVLFLMAGYFYLDANTDVDVSMISWFPLAGMVVFLIVFSMGLGIVPTLMSTELFSSSVKEKSMSINNIVIAALLACTTKIFQVLSEFGLYVPFAFYGFTCMGFTIVCYFIVPETKGKTLDEIQLAFQDKKKRNDDDLYVVKT